MRGGLVYEERSELGHVRRDGTGNACMTALSIKDAVTRAPLRASSTVPPSGPPRRRPSADAAVCRSADPGVGRHCPCPIGRPGPHRRPARLRPARAVGARLCARRNDAVHRAGRPAEQSADRRDGPARQRRLRRPARLGRGRLDGPRRRSRVRRQPPVLHLSGHTGPEVQVIAWTINATYTASHPRR